MPPSSGSATSVLYESVAVDKEDRSPIRTTVATASIIGVFLAVALAALVGSLFAAARTPIMWTIAGVVLTVLLLPAVELLGRWIPRVLAAALILLLLAGAYAWSATASPTT